MESLFLLCQREQNYFCSRFPVLIYSPRNLLIFIYNSTIVFFSKGEVL